MAWLEGWDKRRIKFTVDKDKIDTADLTWFRVVVTLSPTHGDCVFDELTSDDNRFKIAFTKADGTTELYAEIERWDTANQKVIIHVSKYDWVIFYTENTIFYMYYDKDHADNTEYISDTGGVPAQKVWDGNKKLVTHMVDNTVIDIDVGSAASNRNTYCSAGYTMVDKNNPANFTGRITSVQLWADTNMSGVIIATFSASGNNLTARSSYAIGNVTAGSVQTFAVDLNVTIGDYLGFYAAGGTLDLAVSADFGIWYHAGDMTTTTSHAFTFDAGSSYISLYATGLKDILDSTSNNNYGIKKGTGEPASIAGKVGLAQNFDGANDYILFGSPVAPLGAKTYSVLIKEDTVAAYECILDSGGASSAQRGDWIAEMATGKITWIHAKGTSGTFNFEVTTTKTLDANWHHLVFTWDGTTTANAVKIYWDGELEAQGTALSTETVAQTNALRIGMYYIGTTYYGAFDGIIDESHVSSAVRTAAWIKAEYNSLFDTLIAYGSEETEGIILEFFETLSIVDTKATSGTLAKAETLSIVDTKITSGSLGFIETLSIVDSWGGLLTFFETLSIADSKFLTGTLELDETLEIVDSATYQCIKTFYETLSIIDTSTTSGSLNLAETLSIVDSWTVLKTFFETLSITDTVAMGGSLNVSEIISIIDSFIRWIEHPIYTEPAKVKPSYTEPTKVNVSYTEPAKSNPIYTKPAKSNPIYTEPTKGHPVYTEPTKKIKLD